mgnify:CR=1
NSIPIIGAILGIYLVINLALPHLPIDTRVRTYLIQPLMLGTLAAYAWFGKRTVSPRKYPVPTGFLFHKDYIFQFSDNNSY